MNLLPPEKLALLEDWMTVMKQCLLGSEGVFPDELELELDARHLYMYPQASLDPTTICHAHHANGSPYCTEALAKKVM